MDMSEPGLSVPRNATEVERLKLEVFSERKARLLAQSELFALAAEHVALQARGYFEAIASRPAVEEAIAGSAGSART